MEVFLLSHTIFFLNYFIYLLYNLYISINIDLLFSYLNKLNKNILYKNNKKYKLPKSRLLYKKYLKTHILNTKNEKNKLTT